MLTSVKHSPGVLIRYPSSPYTHDEQDYLSAKTIITYVSCVWPQRRFWSKIILNLSGDDSLVDIEIGYPVSIKLRRHCTWRRYDKSECEMNFEQNRLILYHRTRRSRTPFCGVIWSVYKSLMTAGDVAMDTRFINTPSPFTSPSKSDDFVDHRLLLGWLAESKVAISLHVFASSSVYNIRFRAMVVCGSHYLDRPVEANWRASLLALYWFGQLC